MQTKTQNGRFYALGKRLGQPVAWVLRKELHWLTKKGFTPKFAKGIATFANLLILSILLLAIVPIWVMLLVVALVFIVHNGIDTDISAIQNIYNHQEYRGGTDGFGLYDGFGSRIDGGSIDDEN